MFSRHFINSLPPRFRLPASYYRAKIKNLLDDEMSVVDKMLSQKRVFIDIGSNIGLYSYYFRNKFSCIQAFEPLPEVSCQLADLELTNVFIHNVPLSDSFRRMILNIPIEDDVMISALASLEQRNIPSIQRDITTKTLDSYNYQNVDLIKIDVEGHESQVIRGAKNTILSSKPIIIVEIEQRHLESPMVDVFDLIEGHGYQGYFLVDKSLIPISSFSYKTNQLPYINNRSSRRYINNFIFKPF